MSTQNGYTADSEHILSSGHDLKKLAEAMGWRKMDGETYIDLFERLGHTVQQLPDPSIIDAVHAGGLRSYAQVLEASSQKELKRKLKELAIRTVNEPIFQDKKKMETFPRLANFFYHCQRLDRYDKLTKEVEDISEYTWETITCKRNLDRQVEKLFNIKKDKAKFKEASEKIKHIWGFSDKDIDAIRYFVCQTRHKNHNPSMNKALYFWGTEKQTGKTTIARTLVAILNGDKFENAGTYESSLPHELQYGAHDLPLAALYNAVMIDESLPKEASKSYNIVKQALTSSSARYNRKYQSVKSIECRRNYIFTSNDDIGDFIQDKEERRFYAIEMKTKPKHTSFEEIYDIWLQFCVNAEPEDDWQMWYNSFDFVDGLATKDMEEVINEMILQREAIFGIGGVTYTTPKQVADKLFKNEPNRAQKASVKSAMEKLFADCRTTSNPSYYKMSMCYDIAVELANTMELVPDDSEVAQDLPF